MRYDDFFYYADYSDWNAISFVSVCEFAHLAFGFDPIERIHNVTVKNFPDDEYEHLEKFKDFYRRLTRRAEDLPTQSTKLVKIRCSPSGEIRYEAVFLMQWAISNRFMINPNYQPTPLTDEHLYLKAENTDNLTGGLDKKRLIDNGWFNLDACTAPKLKAIIYAYANEMSICAKDKNRKFSTGNVAEHLAKSYEVINSAKTEHGNFFKTLSEIASISPTGRSLKKKAILKNN